MATTQAGRQLVVTTPLGEDFLLIKRFRAYEGLSKLFSVQMELLHEENDDGHEPTIVDPQQILGQNISLKIKQKDGTTRTISGIANHFQQGNRDTRFSYYRATMVPKIWTLTQKFQSRIFQRLTVPEILKKVFKGFDVKYELQAKYEPRNYCVQYQESDFDFASRLMEEEGIYYFFEHAGGSEKMIVADSPQSHRDCPSKDTIACFIDVTDQEEFISSISSWSIDHHLQSGKFTLWDNNFQLPKNKLDAEQPSRFSIGGNQELEIYEYQAGYARKYDGIDKSGGEQPSELQKVFEDKKQTVKVRMEQFDSQYKTVNAIGNCCSLTGGHRFTLKNHPNASQNKQYVIVSIEHQVEQSPEYIFDDEVEEAYVHSFSCIPYGDGNAPFRPSRKTAKPVIRGSQTAMVVGPPGEEIFTDKYGRVKVQFNWDREGTSDINSSCWIRVSQPWAGKGWGTVCIPRIGHEVIVDFIEGDPDQPIITGSVYNPQTMPPYKLPDNKNMMGFMSDSTPGSGGYNEIVIVDGKAGEMIRIHAQKDMDTTVLNNDKQHVVVDRTITVDGKHDETIKGNMSTTVSEGHHTTVIQVGNQVNEVTAGHQANVVKAGQMIHQAMSDIVVLSEGGVVHMEAKTRIEIVVGASSLTMDSSGNITLKGTNVTIIGSAAVNLNP